VTRSAYNEQDNIEDAVFTNMPRSYRFVPTWTSPQEWWQQDYGTTTNNIVIHVIFR